MTTCLPCVIGAGEAGHPSCGRMVRPGNLSDVEPEACACTCDRATAARAELADALAAQPARRVPRQWRRR